MGAAKSAADPLGILKVIDRLTVGPVQLEQDRLVAPYRVERAGRSDTSELVYKYEEPVFDPRDAASQNLAANLAAQVALNYGLFCRDIVFRGPYDRADQRFLEAMAQNTAREIYVKKFLEPNPFLHGPAATLPAVKRPNYLRARLSFPEGEPPTARARSGPAVPDIWTTDRRRHAILSSGGKDSLLTYGLLDEIGCETHPVFINESGRHWFTALNAYRHFSAVVPNTARVWTNSDRLFSWMLRHLPFVREDFANVRSDEYPIRLWTVAVFIFGALPLARKRGAGRLLIGDEYDTTVRTVYQGITHYDGLFDQSRYFDHAMTRYFQRKGWGIAQFSVIRPLSEFLILKILAERYPELQRHQTSCHATHKEADRIRPCGRCEKCRRIVGMLTALGADPKACGYTEEQIRNCLADLAAQGVHQETAGAEHMAHLLQQRGLLPAGRLGQVKARPRPEIAQLRFDRERSPEAAVPVDLRERIFPILLEHAEGAVRRSGRVWLECDPLDPAILAQPYPFEKVGAAAGRGRSAAAGGAGARGSEAGGPTDYLLGELSWPAAEQRFREVDVALLPVGATEQHGPHLPLDTDAFDADYLAKRVAATCTVPRPLVLPLIPYGVSYHHDDFSGTLSVGPRTLSQMVYEVGMAVARHGITKLVIINGHGGNAPALNFAAQMINRDAHIFTCVDTGETSDTDIEALAETSNDVHSGEIETSTTLATRPGLVLLDAAEKHVPTFSSEYLDFSSRRSVDWYAYVAKISPTGVLGDPTKATAEKGEKMWELMVQHLVRFVEHLKRLSLDQIYERRY